MGLIQPVAENAIHRPGHQAFSRTVGDALNELARRDEKHAWLRHELEQLKKGNGRNGR